MSPMTTFEKILRYLKLYLELKTLDNLPRTQGILDVRSLHVSEAEALLDSLREDLFQP